MVRGVMPLAGLVLALALAGPGCICTGSGGNGNGSDSGGVGNGSDNGIVPPTDGAPPPPPPIDGGSCVSENVTAMEGSAPVDIIWVVDSSGSMSDEEAEVQNGLNAFSNYIVGAGVGIDYHVILIGDASEMNVPPPLGGSPEFLHVDMSVGSTNALEKIIQAYPQYQTFLRNGAVVHFVVVTDDESDWSQATFDAALAGLTMPGFPNGYTFHAICSEDTGDWLFPACQNGLLGGGAAEPGLIYIGMVGATGGVWESICQANWTPIFMAVATAVAVSTVLPCSYEIPDPPMGKTLDPNQVNLVFTDSAGNQTTIPNVGDPSGCGAMGGWYYDDPVNPANVIVCDLTCTAFQADPGGSVEVGFGCETFIL